MIICQSFGMFLIVHEDFNDFISISFIILPLLDDIRIQTILENAQ